MIKCWLLLRTAVCVAGKAEREQAMTVIKYMAVTKKISKITMKIFNTYNPLLETESEK